MVFEVSYGQLRAGMGPVVGVGFMAESSVLVAKAWYRQSGHSCAWAGSSLYTCLCEVGFLLLWLV